MGKRPSKETKEKLCDEDEKLTIKKFFCCFYNSKRNKPESGFSNEQIDDHEAQNSTSCSNFNNNTISSTPEATGFPASSDNVNLVNVVEVTESSAIRDRPHSSSSRHVPECTPIDVDSSISLSNSLLTESQNIPTLNSVEEPVNTSQSAEDNRSSSSVDAQTLQTIASSYLNHSETFEENSSTNIVNTGKQSTSRENRETNSENEHDRNVQRVRHLLGLSVETNHSMNESQAPEAQPLTEGGKCDYCEEYFPKVEKCPECMVANYCGQECRIKHHAVHKVDCIRKKAFNVVLTLTEKRLKQEHRETLSLKRGFLEDIPSLWKFSLGYSRNMLVLIRVKSLEAGGDNLIANVEDYVGKDARVAFCAESALYPLERVTSAISIENLKNLQNIEMSKEILPLKSCLQPGSFVWIWKSTWLEFTNGETVVSVDSIQNMYISPI